MQVDTDITKHDHIITSTTCGFEEEMYYQSTPPDCERPSDLSASSRKETSITAAPEFDANDSLEMTLNASVTTNKTTWDYLSRSIGNATFSLRDSGKTSLAATIPFEGPPQDSNSVIAVQSCDSANGMADVTEDDLEDKLSVQIQSARIEDFMREDDSDEAEFDSDSSSQAHSEGRNTVFEEKEEVIDANEETGSLIQRNSSQSTLDKNCHVNDRTKDRTVELDKHNDGHEGDADIITASISSRSFADKRISSDSFEPHSASKEKENQMRKFEHETQKLTHNGKERESLESKNVIQPHQIESKRDSEENEEKEEKVAMDVPSHESDAPKDSNSQSLPQRIRLDEQAGYVRIYYQNKNFMSSTVFRVSDSTTILNVRRSMAKKLSLARAEFGFYIVVMVYPSSSSSTRSVSARTLRDEELIFPLITKETQNFSSNEEDARVRLKHRSRPPLKFVFRDSRGTPLNLQEDIENRSEPNSRILSAPTLLGNGIHCGYLQKASMKDPNVWRKRWFVLKDDQLMYCKSNTDQRDITSISLLNAYLAKARPELRVPFAFELRTPRRVYQLCTTSKSDMLSWIHALHVQIGISTENHRLYQAEILISDDTVNKLDEHCVPTDSEPPLLLRILSREDTRQQFFDFVQSSNAQVLLDTWTECETFRRQGIARESGRPKRPPRDAWNHLKQIIQAIQSLPVIRSKDAQELQEAFHSEQINRRLSLALHADSKVTEYPPFELLAPVQHQIFQALEKGPFKEYLGQRGYRQLLERIMGRFF